MERWSNGRKQNPHPGTLPLGEGESQSDCDAQGYLGYLSWWLSRCLGGRNGGFAVFGGAGVKVGDRVRIQETRPLSKTKCWRLVEVVERNEEVAKVA